MISPRVHCCQKHPIKLQALLLGRSFANSEVVLPILMSQLALKLMNTVVWRDHTTFTPDDKDKNSTQKFSHNQ